MEGILTELASAQLSLEGESVRFPEQAQADGFESNSSMLRTLSCHGWRKMARHLLLFLGSWTLYFSDPELPAV